jgi:hypothetical protein
MLLYWSNFNKKKHKKFSFKYFDKSFFFLLCRDVITSSSVNFSNHLLNKKMKNKIKILILGSLCLTLFTPKLTATDLSVGDGIGLAGVAIAVYGIIDGNCDDKRTEGTLQYRMKDGVCQVVNYISFRKICEPVLPKV